jgi:hypothetical protein
MNRPVTHREFNEALRVAFAHTERRNQHKVRNNIVKTVLAIAMIVFSYVVAAWAYALLWTWFAVPIGLPVLNGVHLMGLSLVFNTITGNQTHATTLKDFKAGAFSKIAMLVSITIGANVAALLLGLIYLRFM